MARPTLDQIFASNQAASNRPSLDSIFSAGGQQSGTDPVAQAYQASRGSYPYNVSPMTNAVTPNSMNAWSSAPADIYKSYETNLMNMGPDVQKAALTAQATAPIDVQKAIQTKQGTSPIETKQAIQTAIGTAPIEVKKAVDIKKGEIGPSQTESLGGKAGEEILSGATSIAKDAELGDLMTSAMRARMENYAQAYKGGALGGMVENLRGTLGQHPITQTLDGGIDKDAISARSAFESSTNGLLSQGQQVFAGQMGTGNASTRIMSSVLDLLKGEFGGTGDSPASMIGRNQGSQQTIYMIQKFGGQYLNTLNKMGITPSNIDSLPKEAIDKIADGFKNSVQQGMQTYQLTPQDRSIIKARADYINEPLKEMMSKGKSSSVDYKDLLKDIK